MKKGMARRGNFSSVPKKTEETPDNGIRSKYEITAILDNPKERAIGMSNIIRTKNKIPNNNPAVMMSYLPWLRYSIKGVRMFPHGDYLPSAANLSVDSFHVTSSIPCPWDDPFCPKIWRVPQRYRTKPRSEKQ